MARRLKYLFLAVPPLFYFFTTARTVGQADQAILIQAMSEGDIGAGATHHSLTVLVGHAFQRLLPFGEIAFRSNLVSTCFGSLTVGLFFLLCLRLTKSSLAAAFSAVFLMVSHSLWWHSTIAENYATSSFFSVVVLYCLVRLEDEARDRWLAAAACAAGLGMFNHLQMGMWLPGILLVSLLRPAGSLKGRLARTLKAGCWIAVGLIPYAAAFVQDLMHSRSVDQAAQNALGGDFTRLFFSADSTSAFATALAGTGRIFMLQWGWPSLFWVYVAVGAYLALRGAAPRAAHVAGVAAFLVNTGFFAFYPTWDRYAFLLQSIVVLGFLGANGLGHLWNAWLGKSRVIAALLVVANVVFCLYPIYFFDRLTDLARDSRLWRSFVVTEAGVNMTGADARFLAEPNKRDYRSVDDFARQLFARLPTDSVLIDHIGRTYYPLTFYFQNFYEMRRDLRVLLFAPSGIAAGSRRWPGSISGPEAVELVARSLPERGVFLSAHVGFDEVVGPSLERGIAFIEYPLGPRWRVYQAREVGDLVLADWVDGVRAGLLAAQPLAESRLPIAVSAIQVRALGLHVRLKKGNPALKVHVEWSTPAGTTKRRGADCYIPQNAPLMFIPGTGEELSPGPWTAELLAFGQSIGVARFQID